MKLAMDFKSAISKLREGKLQNQFTSTSNERLQNCSLQTPVTKSSLFTLDDWDEFDTDEDIFRDGDGISFSPQLSLTCSDSQQQLREKGEDTASIGSSTEIENEIGNGSEMKYLPTLEERNQVVNTPPGGKTGVGTRASRSGVQKLKSFQFVKMDRKRSGDKLTRTGLDCPPSKKGVVETGLKSDDKKVPNSLDDDQLIKELTDDAESSVPRMGFQVNYPTSGGQCGDLFMGASGCKIAEAANTQSSSSSAGAGPPSKPRNSTSPTARLNSNLIGISPHKATATLTSASTKPLSKMTVSNKKILPPFSSKQQCVASFSTCVSNHTTSHRNFSEATNSSTDLPGSTRSSDSEYSRQSTTSHLMAPSTNHSTGFPPRTDAATPKKYLARSDPSTPLLQTNNAATAFIHSLRARPRADPSGHSRPPPISTLSGPSSANFPAAISSRPASLLSSTSQSSNSTPLPLTSLKTARPASSAFSTPIAPRNRSATPTPHVAAVSSLHGPSKRPHLSTPTSALMCTPASTPGSSGIEILRTPVPVPQRKFPGPAGLLPRLAPGQSMDSIFIAPPTNPNPVSTPRLAQIPSSRLRRRCGRTGEVKNGCNGNDGGELEEEFGQGPWVEMLQDLDLSDSQCSALLKYSIAQAIRQFSTRQLRNCKVTHLRVVLKSISLSGRNGSGILKDPTGEIMCTLHSQVLDDYKKDLLVGAVLILRKVSMFSPSLRKQYLNITPSNIVRIYPPDGNINSDSPLVLSEFERLQSPEQDSAEVSPPILSPRLPTNHYKETLPLQSPLFPASASVIAGYATSNTMEGRNRLHEAISNTRCRSVVGAEVARTTEHVASNAESVTRGCINSNKPHAPTVSLMDQARTNELSSKTSGSHDIGSGSCDFSSKTGGLSSHNIKRGWHREQGSRNSNITGEQHSLTLASVSEVRRNESLDVNRSCDADNLFLTDICEDEFDTLFGDMMDF